MHFKNKVIWITGASSGIGAALAKKLAAQQTSLILSARNISALERVQKECEVLTKNCNILPVDLLSDSIEDITEKAISLFGYIDIHISCAGVSQRSLATETSLAVYRSLMEINFFAPICITRALLPHFTKRGTGHIAVISSVAGLMGFPLRSGYSAAKHALQGFFETLQIENVIQGIHFTIISPGRIYTPISLSALTGNGTPYQVMDEGQVNGIPVEQCADKILTAIERKKKHVIIARGERILWWFWWFLPRVYYSIARKAGMK
jgi:dehydrogenase/reductase SDR family protein 7B